MKRFMWLGCGGLVLVVFGWTLYFLYSKSQEVPVVFQTEKPFVTDIVQKTVATGAIVPRREVAIKPRVSGIVEKLFVEPGEYIKKGDKIARIRIIPNMVSLNQAEARLKAANINFESSKSELERNQVLYRDNLISESEWNRFQVDYDLKKEERTAAENNLQLIKEGASSKSGKVSNVVMSTVEGTLLEVPVKEGSSVIESNNFNDGTTIASVADLKDMIFEGKVDESEVGKISEGMELRIRIGAIEKTEFDGRLEYISPKGVIENGAIQFQIRAAIVPKEGVLIRAGYSANADIVLERKEKVLAINESLLQFEDDKPYVEVEIGPQKFEKRNIEVGLSDGINIELLAGLDKDTKIKKPQ